MMELVTPFIVAQRGVERRKERKSDQSSPTTCPSARGMTKPKERQKNPTGQLDRVREEVITQRDEHPDPESLEEPHPTRKAAAGESKPESLAKQRVSEIRNAKVGKT
jgi:hypothetical protein